MRNVSFGNDSIPNLAVNVLKHCPLGLKTTENVPDWAEAAGVVAAAPQARKGIVGAIDEFTEYTSIRPGSSVQSWRTRSPGVYRPSRTSFPVESTKRR